MLKNRPLLLILVCAALGALVWYDNRPDASAPPAQVPPSALSAQVPMPAADATPSADAESAGMMQLSNPLASLDKESLKDWVERPLFTQSRKRPTVIALAAKGDQHVAVVPPPSIYILLGIVLDGDRALALLRKRADGKNFRVVVGDMIGGWRVAKIEPTTVVLENLDGSSETMTLTR